MRVVWEEFRGMGNVTKSDAWSEAGDLWGWEKTRI